MTEVIDPSSLTVEQLSGDVHPLLHALRERAPVAWVPAIERWLVTSREMVLEAMLDAETFTVDDPRFTTAQVVGPSMLSLDGADHARHREPFARPFRRSATIAGFERSTHAAASRLVTDAAAAAAAGPIDLRTVLAAPLAVQTITDALGLVGVDAAQLLGWYRDIVSAVEVVTAGADRAASTADAFRELDIAVRRSLDEPESPIAAIAARSDLTATELVSNTAVMLFGAIETSEGMTANALAQVLGDAEAQARLRAEPQLVGAAVDESLRLEPAATLVDRYVTVDTQLGGIRLPAGAAVSLSLAGANRDPVHFGDPDRFDLDRSNASHHLAFVHGPHACIGMHLARLETGAALRAVLDAFASIRLSEPAPATGLVFRKPAAVWAEPAG